VVLILGFRILNFEFRLIEVQMRARRLQMELLGYAGRLLLENNESTGAIHRTLVATAQSLSQDACTLVVGYGGLAVSLAGEGPVLMPIRQLHYNSALQAHIHSILEAVRRGDLQPLAALARLRQAEADTPRHPRLPAILMLGVAAASLAGLLGADAGGVMVTGLATGLGLAARQELGRRRFNVLMLPLAAAFIGAVLGGLAIRLGWTGTPGLALVVPSLMLVPGPHLINGLLDMIDNYVPMGIARLGLAITILLACGLGITFGIELTLADPIVADQGITTDHLNVFSDMLLAGIVTCGFAVFYNTPWALVAMAVVGGMAGHGLRFLTMKAGLTLDAATLLGGLAVGIVSAWIARSNKTPVAIIAFAGAVTMMPGMQIYRALAGAMSLARLKHATDQSSIAEMLGDASQACLVVGALALGVIVGARIVSAVAGERDSPKTSETGSNAVEIPVSQSSRNRLPSESATRLPGTLPQDTVDG
jgi:uncharacterized membrane protein YjjP (DUF1212 family)